MHHSLPSLGFAIDSAQPFLSVQALSDHHGLFHGGHVDALNRKLAGSDMEELDLTELIKRTSGALYCDAAQHYSHSFYWKCLCPGSESAPAKGLRHSIETQFGSFEKLRKLFLQTAKQVRGSGWCWLTQDAHGRLRVTAMKDAGCPIALGETPLLACDLWEHAFLLDYKNRKEDYVQAFWKIIDWGFVTSCFEDPEGIENRIVEHS